MHAQTKHIWFHTFFYQFQVMFHLIHLKLFCMEVWRKAQFKKPKCHHFAMGKCWLVWYWFNFEKFNQKINIMNQLTDEQMIESVTISIKLMTQYTTLLSTTIFWKLFYSIYIVLKIVTLWFSNFHQKNSNYYIKQEESASFHWTDAVFSIYLQSNKQTNRNSKWLDGIK